MEKVHLVVLFPRLFGTLKVPSLRICTGALLALEEDSLTSIHATGGGFRRKFWNPVLVINSILGIALPLTALSISDSYSSACFSYLLRLVKKLGPEGALKMVSYACLESCSLPSKEDIFWFSLGMSCPVSRTVLFKFSTSCRHCWVNSLTLFST